MRQKTTSAVIITVTLIFNGTDTFKKVTTKIMAKEKEIKLNCKGTPDPIRACAFQTPNGKLLAAMETSIIFIANSELVIPNCFYLK